MNPSTMTVAQYLVQRLAELGVEHLFAVPGDYAGAFLGAVDSDPRMQRVGTCNELEAGYAADAYARLRGVGAVCVTYGVGAFSLLNAIAGPYVEQIAVVAIVGSPTFDERRKARREGVLYHHSTGNLKSNVNAFRDVTVAVEVLRDAAQAPAQIDRLLTACLTWNRPVYLEVYENLWTSACAAPVGRLSAEAPEVDEGALNEAVTETIARLAAAQRPVIWGGVEIQRFRLQDTLANLIAQTGLPFATDLLGKAILEEDHPNFVGVYSGAAASKTVRDLVEQSDCVLGLGTLITDDFLDLIAHDYGAMILAWSNRVRIGYHAYTRVPLQSFLTRLSDRLAAASFTAPEGAASAFAPLAGLFKEPAASAPDAPITYESFFRRMRDFVDESMVLLADESNSLYVAADLPIHRRNGFIAQAAWGSIGYTVGAAVGVGFAAPEKRAVVFVGDGGFQMICQALSTIVRYEQGAIVFVMRNGIYGIEQALVNLKFYTEGQPPEAFNLLPQWNYTRLTDVFGGWGTTVATERDLEEALTHVRTNTRTLSLIEVHVPERDLPPQIYRLATDPG